MASRLIPSSPRPRGWGFFIAARCFTTGGRDGWRIPDSGVWYSRNHGEREHGHKLESKNLVPGRAVRP